MINHPSLYPEVRLRNPDRRHEIRVLLLTRFPPPRKNPGEREMYIRRYIFPQSQDLENAITEYLCSWELADEHGDTRISQI